MKTLQLFNYEHQEIRVLGTPAAPLFVAKDICEILGYKQTTKALRLLDSDEKRGCQIGTPGGNQRMSCITESGMWCLIIKSTRPEAKKIRKWVTGEVLPSIRKTGGYDMRTPPPLDINGMTAYRYDFWLISNGYSASSGSYHRRKRLHPEHFYRSHRDGKWYINALYAKALLGYRKSKDKINQVQPLPSPYQVGLFSEESKQVAAIKALLN